MSLSNILPYALSKGDTIGIIAPASSVQELEVELGIASIEARGYRVQRGKYLYASHADNGYLAGEDALRIDDLHRMFEDPSINAIFCAGGGYGSMRLFGKLDIELIRANPKIFVGFSDITSLHLAIGQSANRVTFHGKMVVGLDKLDSASTDCLWKQLESLEPFGLMPVDPERLTTLVPGEVVGELAGGCLCLLAHACGSKYSPDFRGKIVLIEDVGEPIYRLDRFLSQLINAGAFDETLGFIIGTATAWEKQEADPPKSTLDALWKSFFVPMNKPTITDFPFGHIHNPLTLPLGRGAKLDATNKTVALLEASVQRR